LRRFEVVITNDHSILNKVLLIFHYKQRNFVIHQSDQGSFTQINPNMYARNLIKLFLLCFIVTQEIINASSTSWERFSTVM
jgi:hypothetical protein